MYDLFGLDLSNEDSVYIDCFNNYEYGTKPIDEKYALRNFTWIDQTPGHYHMLFQNI